MCLSSRANHKETVTVKELKIKTPTCKRALRQRRTYAQKTARVRSPDIRRKVYQNWLIVSIYTVRGIFDMVYSIS